MIRSSVPGSSWMRSEASRIISRRRCHDFTGQSSGEVGGDGDRSGQFHGAGRDLRDLIPSSIMKITLRCKLLKTQGGISWLGGRDSNPDNVLQRAVLGFRSASARSVLLRSSHSHLRYASVCFDVFLRGSSLCVSLYEGSEAQRRHIRTSRSSTARHADHGHC